MSDKIPNKYYYHYNGITINNNIYIKCRLTSLLQVNHKSEDTQRDLRSRKSCNWSYNQWQFYSKGVQMAFLENYLIILSRRRLCAKFIVENLTRLMTFFLKFKK